MPSSTQIREPKWPKERDLDRYNILVEFNIPQFLSTGGTWIEIGIGKGGRPMLPLIGQSHVTLKAIAPHYRSLPAGIELTTGYVPDHQDFLLENRGTAKLVTDIFGSVSYYKDPLQALIYGSLLLAPGGTFVTFTELRRIGDLETWDRISQFFAQRLQQQISFQTVFVLGDASRKYSTCLRIRVEGKAKVRASLATLFKDAQRAIGVPHRGELIWVSSDQLAKIWRVNYSHPSE